MNEIYDAVILGAGPAGLSTAAKLCGAGWKVLIVEKSSFPREKVCGGFIGPENQPFLEELGVWEKLRLNHGQLIRQVHLTASRGASVRMPMLLNGEPVQGLGSARRDLDTLLAEAVTDQGVLLFAPAMVSQTIRNGAGPAKLKIIFPNRRADEWIRARCIIDASGARRDAQDRNAISAYGLGALFETSDADEHDCVELHFVPRGHLGINPTGKNLQNICFVADRSLVKAHAGNPEKLFRYFVQKNSYIAQRASHLKQATAWKGIPVVNSSRPRCYDRGVFYAGDAVAAVNPVVGGGITMALYGGFLLGSVLGEFDPKDLSQAEAAQRYEKKWRAYFLNKIWLSKIWGYLSHQEYFADPVLRFLSLRKDMFEKMFELHHPWPVQKGVYGQ